MAGAASIIADVMGPPGASSTPKPAPDAHEGDEGGEGELETHLRAWQKAMRDGDMRTAAESFRSAVSASQGGGYQEME
jgi:hypothetical protein